MRGTPEEPATARLTLTEKIEQARDAAGRRGYAVTFHGPAAEAHVRGCVDGYDGSPNSAASYATPDERESYQYGFETIVRSLCAVLPLHGFGVKTDGLSRYARWLTSADSMAWSIAGRRTSGCAPGHRSEANCQRYALAWRENVLRAAHTPTRYQPTLFSTPRANAVIA